jgi:hypothetical protein
MAAGHQTGLDVDPGLPGGLAVPDEFAAPGQVDVPEDDSGIAVPDATAAPGSVAFGVGLTLGALGQSPIRQPRRGAAQAESAAAPGQVGGLPSLFTTGPTKPMALPPEATSLELQSAPTRAR